MTGPNSNGQRLALVRLLLQHLADPTLDVGCSLLVDGGLTV